MSSKLKLLMILLVMSVGVNTLNAEEKKPVTKKATVTKKTTKKKTTKKTTETKKTTKDKLKLAGGFQVLPGTMMKVDIGVGGEEPIIVALDKAGQPYKLLNDWKSWDNISPYFPALQKLPEGTVVSITTQDGKTLGVKDGQLVLGGKNNFIILRKGNWVGLKSPDAGNRNLQAASTKISNISVPKFVNYNFHKTGHGLEHMTIFPQNDNSLKDVTLYFSGVKRFLTVDKKGQLVIAQSDDPTSFNIKVVKKVLPGTKQAFEITYAGYGSGSSLKNITDRVREITGQATKKVNFRVSQLGAGGGKGSRLELQWRVGSKTYKGSYLANGKVDITIPSKVVGIPYTKFSTISVAGDDTLWALDFRGKVWKRQGETWQMVSGTFKDISVGSRDEVWGVTQDDKPFRKKDPRSDLKNWQFVPGRTVHIGAGGDGQVWAAGVDQKLLQFNRQAKTWRQVVRPASIGLGSPQKISCADQFNLVFLDYQGRGWQRLPGAEGTQQQEWRQAITKTRLKDIAIGNDGTIVGINMKDQVVVQKPSETDQQELDAARGPVIHGRQIVRMKTGENFGGDRVWTHAKSSYADVNYRELVIGTDDPRDKRQDIGSFFAFLDPEDMQSTKTLEFGQTVEIYSLYAVLGELKKSGALSYEFKWFMKAQGSQFGQSWRDVVAALVQDSNTRDGKQLFKVESPYGQKGAIRSNDTIRLVSLAPHSKNRTLFVKAESRLNEGFTSSGFKSLVMSAPGNPDGGAAKGFYGRRDRSGAEHFTIQAVNGEADLPEIKNSFFTNETPVTVFRKIKGLFFQDASQAGAAKKAGLIARLTAGIAIVREIGNQTDFPLDLGDLGIVPAKDTLQGKDRNFARPLKISGAAKDPRIQMFGPDQMLTMRPMMSKGYAWLESSLKTPGSATLSFMAKGTDKANIQVCLDSKMSLKPKWRIIIGGWNNTRSVIEYDGRIMSEAKAVDNPITRVSPGNFVPYWISVHDSFMMVGAGNPGQNVFLSCFMPKDANVSRVAFSSHDGPVTFAEVKVGQHLVPLAEATVYTVMKDVYDVPQGGSGTLWTEIPMRVPSEGAIGFTAQAKHSVGIVLENEQKEQYKIVIGEENNNKINIYNKGRVVSSLNIAQIPQAQFIGDEPKKFWISIEGSILMVGQGEIGNNMLMCYYDQKPLLNMSKIGFEPTDHAQKISGVTLAPPVKIGTPDREVAYKKEIKRFAYKSSVIMVRPFQYELIQNDMSVAFKDMLQDGKIYPVMSCPQQGAKYYFRLIFDQNGIPDYKLLYAPEDAPAKRELQKEAFEKEMTANLTAEIGAATAEIGMTSGAALMQAGASLASSFDSSAVYTGMGLALGGVAAQSLAAVQKGATDIAAAKLRHESAKKSFEAQTKFRALDHYVYTEQVQRKLGAGVQIPQMAIQNMQIIQQKLMPEAEALNYRDVNMYLRLVDIYQEIIYRINHPFVVQDEAFKLKIYGGLKQLLYVLQDTAFKAVLLPPQDVNVAKLRYSKLIELFTSALSNGYLVDSNNRKEMLAKEDWYNKMVELGYEIMKMAILYTNFAVTVPTLSGEYLWIPGQSEKTDTILITFEAKGRNDLFLCFAKEDTNVRNTDNEIYEVVLGAWNNKKHEVRIKSLGRAAKFAAAQATRLHPRRFTKYWAMLNKGTITVGTGDQVGQNTFLTWKDPFPWKGISFVGISNWDTETEIRNIRSNLISEEIQAIQAAAIAAQQQAAQQQAQAVPVA